MGRKTQMNSITNSEKTAQINKSNLRLKDDFLAYLTSIQRSPDTIAGYDNDLLIVFTYILDNLDNKEFVNLTKRDVISLQNWLVNKNGNSPSRVRRIKATLSSLSNYIENVLDDEYPNYRNIIHKIESPVNQPVREKTVLTDEQVDSLLEYLVSKKKYDKACLLALAVCSGRRKSELTRFKVSYFDDENLICDGALYKTSEKIKTKGRGVNGKQIYCYTLAKKFKPYFDLWMKHRAQNNIESIWLFPMKNNPDKHIKPQTLTSWATTFGRILGVDFYMHALRHCWTTGLIRAGLPETVIKELAQWSNLDMVAIYNDCEAEEQFANYFKNGNIDTSQKRSLIDL